MIRNLCFTPASRVDVAGGLLGWLRVDIGPVRIDGITLRRTRKGALVLAYPVRRDRQDREHTIALPTTAEAERSIEQAVLVELRRRGDIQ